MLEHAYLIPLVPFLASLLILFFGRRLPQEGAWLGILAALYGLLHSLVIAAGIQTGSLILPHDGPGGRFFEMAVDWFTVGRFRLELGVLVDGLSAVMLVVVTGVSFLVQLYSLGYQEGKPRFGRYYAYLSFFTASMLLVVLANNLFQFFIGWELVGVSSYLLIGFEFERPSAAAAGQKAFLTTRVGDVGFYLGLLLLLTKCGTFNFPILHEQAALLSPLAVSAVALLLFCGAAGKSAQLPLHVWLPDAMEGPTPVSALIHAATMVAAGVYLLARFHFVFALSPAVLEIVAWTGGLTALGAALSALTASDIKKVLAYSTISQLGYMMMAMGVGNPQAGMFHLTTHAFFKALLFLGAGSVIHAVHTNDIWKMGGLSKKMPTTFITFTCGTLALIGFPFLSGHYSKEGILAAAIGSGHTVLFVIGALTAALTAFYMSRLVILMFLGDSRDNHRFSHAHEGPATMTVPLWILALLSVFTGFTLTYVFPFGKWIPLVEEAARHYEFLVLLVSLGALIVGAGLAWSIYGDGIAYAERLGQRWSGLHRLLGRRLFDECYDELIARFVHAPARALARLDDALLDRWVIDGAGRLTGRIAVMKRWFDDAVVDGFFVDGMGRLSQSLGAGFRKIQTGYAQFYTLVTALGLIVLLVWVVRVFG